MSEYFDLLGLMLVCFFVVVMSLVTSNFKVQYLLVISSKCSKTSGVFQAQVSALLKTSFQLESQKAAISYPVVSNTHFLLLTIKIIS